MTAADQAGKIFAALADPTRRDMLERLSQKRCGVSELAQHYRMSLPAVSKHVRTLEEARLLTKVKVGRSHMCTIVPEAISVAVDQISFYRNFWTTQLDSIDEYLQIEGEEMRSVNITKEFYASRESVFRAIANGLLFRDTGIINESLELDFRTGGSYSFEWVSGGRCSGTFTEIAANERIELTWDTTEVEAPTGNPTTVEIGLSDRGDSTLLTLVHSGIPAGKSYDDHLRGWTTSFDEFSTSMERIHDAGSYRWDKQVIEELYPESPSDIFTYWSSIEGLKNFLIESGSITDPDGAERAADERIYQGDRYSFVLDNGHPVYGKFVVVEDGARLLLSFGEVDLEVRFVSSKVGSKVVLTLRKIPLLEEGKVIYHIRLHDFLLKSLHRLKILMADSAHD